MTSRAGSAPGGGGDDLSVLASGGRTNILGFLLRLAARLPFLFVAGRLYGPDLVGRFALAVVVVELAALLATLGLKRGLAQALSSAGERPQAHVVWDAMAVAFVASLIASAVLIAFPEAMYPNSRIEGIDRWLPLVIVATAWSDISLAALAYRRDVTATVTARAIVEPWTISFAAWGFFEAAVLIGPQSGGSLDFLKRDGLILAYMLSMVAALVASLIPFIRSYGVPHGWSPRFSHLFALAARNVPLAGADAVEWATRNVDRFILGVMFEPKIVGIYYMAQQVASIPGKLKTSFDPILGPVITTSLARDDRGAVAAQVRQVGYWVVAAQVGLALVGSIPGEAVMGVVGPQFVAGTAALAFLLTAEAAASTGAVSESALIYLARMRNLLISFAMLCFQIVTSFGLILAMRWIGWPVIAFDAGSMIGLSLTFVECPVNYQAAGPAVALLLSVGITSIIKSNYLSSLLGARVSGWRWPILWASIAAILVGTIFTSLPQRLEWMELIVGVPAIAAVYLLVLFALSSSEDRALLRRKAPSDAAA